MTKVLLPTLSCHYCDYTGSYYLTKVNGPHTEAICPRCEKHIKYLSKQDKYGTKEQQDAIWKKTKGRCCYCGEALNPFNKNGYTYEHVNPQKNGGSHDTENLMPCCKSCNSEKGGKTLKEYRLYKCQKHNSKTWIFYFEIMQYSHLGTILKNIF